MGQQCRPCNSQVPNLEQDLKITNLQVIEEVNQLRLQHKTAIKESKVYHLGEAIFRGKFNKNKQKQGYGEFYNKNSLFMGNFQEDQPNGSGLALKDENHYYRGTFKDGQFHGSGKEYGPDFTFQGEFQQGFRKKGLFKNQQLQYFGEFQNNIFHGDGLIVFQNGVRYEGKFSEGKIHGKGVVVFANKIFRGQMVNGFCRDGRFQWIRQPEQNKPSKLYLYIYDKKEATSGKSIQAPTSETKEVPTPRSINDQTVPTTSN